MCNTTLAGLGSSLLPEAGLVNGVTGYIMLPPQAFCFYNGVAASGVRPLNLLLACWCSLACYAVSTP